jgi:uncharacterized protein
MKKILTTASLALLLCASAVAQAREADPSFNCHRARSADEITICHNPELAEMDNTLAYLYSTVRKQLRPSARKNFQQDEAYWLQQRRDCGRDQDCIRDAYQNRTDQLYNIANGLGLVGD